MSITQSLISLIDAKNELDEARSKCEFDADYFCHNEIIRLEKAELSFTKELDAIIDKRLSERGLL